MATSKAGGNGGFKIKPLEEEITQTILSVRMSKVGTKIKFELLRVPLTAQEEYYLKQFLQEKLFNEDKIIDIN